MSAETDLVELLAEMRGFPRPPPDDDIAPSQVLLPMRVRLGDQVLSLMSIVTLFGTAVDITLARQPRRGTACGRR